MIKLENYTPEIYYKMSRDFQLLGRLYDVILNSTKTNADIIYNLPLNDNTDERFINLMTLTLGFKNRHNYNVKQLTALCSAFTSIIKLKGSIESIKLAANTLIHSEGLTQDAEVSIDNNIVTITLPKNIASSTLFYDILDYILPAGLSVEINEASILPVPATTPTVSADQATITSIINNEYSQLAIIGSASEDYKKAISGNTHGNIGNGLVNEIKGE